MATNGALDHRPEGRIPDGRLAHVYVEQAAGVVERWEGVGEAGHVWIAVDGVERLEVARLECAQLEPLGHERKAHLRLKRDGPPRHGR